MNETFNIKTLLEIIFKVTNKNAIILAHTYLLKDKSIISKWKNGKAFPRNDDITRIVEFVKNESTLSQQKIIRDKIEGLIKNNSIRNEIKNIILDTTNFCDFLQEAISASVSLNENSGEIKNSEETEDADKNNSRGIIKNQNGRYKGVLEFDLLLTQGNEIKASCHTEDSNMALNGKVNLSKENKLIKTVSHVKKAAAYGVLLLFIASGILITASLVGTQSSYSKGSSDKNMERSRNMAYYENKLSTPIPTSKHSSIPSPTLVPVAAPKPAVSVNPSIKPQISINKNSTVQKTKKTTVNNETKDTTIINNGNHSVIIVGNQNTYGDE